jgi:hypothetical protein
MRKLLAGSGTANDRRSAVAQGSGDVGTMFDKSAWCSPPHNTLAHGKFDNTMFSIPWST